MYLSETWINTQHRFSFTASHLHESHAILGHRIRKYKTQNRRFDTSAAGMIHGATAFRVPKPGEIRLHLNELLYDRLSICPPVLILSAHRRPESRRTAAPYSRLNPEQPLCSEPVFPSLSLNVTARPDDRPAAGTRTACAHGTHARVRARTRSVCGSRRHVCGAVPAAAGAATAEGSRALGRPALERPPQVVGGGGAHSCVQVRARLRGGRNGAT